jgi:predicted nucleic acid-binding protein
VIILDTNVLSALMRDVPEAEVVRWLDGVPAQSVWTTSVSAFEIGFGLAILPDGARKRRLTEKFEQLMEDDLEGRVLALDRDGAAAAAEIAAAARAAGRPIDIRDVQIAGIVRSRHAALATRNLRHFREAGFELIDPWSLGAG